MEEKAMSKKDIILAIQKIYCYMEDFGDEAKLSVIQAELAEIMLREDGSYWDAKVDATASRSANE
jgi:hypothetical protein